MITVLDDRELKSAEDGGATALFAPQKQIELEVKLEVEGRRTDERSSRGSLFSCLCLFTDCLLLLRGMERR